MDILRQLIWESYLLQAEPQLGELLSWHSEDRYDCNNTEENAIILNRVQGLGETKVGYQNVVFFYSFIQGLNYAKVTCDWELSAACRYSPGKINRGSQFYSEWKAEPDLLSLSVRILGKLVWNGPFCSYINGDYALGQTGMGFEHWPGFQKKYVSNRKKLQMHTPFSLYCHLLSQWSSTS